MRLIHSVSFNGAIPTGGVMILLNHTTYTLPVGADVWVEVDVSGLSVDELVDVRCVVGGKKARTYVPHRHSTYAPAVGFPAEEEAMNLRVPLGPVAGGSEFGVELLHVPSQVVSGAVRLWAVDAINAMNVAMPESKATGSVLAELHLAKAALVNRRTHDVPTGVNVIRDDDGETVLVTLTPSENGGVVTIMPS